MARSLHERVAARMVMSQVGNYHTYDTILVHLREHHTEESLARMIDDMEKFMRHAKAVPPDWKFLDDDE